jgi:thermitase
MNMPTKVSDVPNYSFRKLLLTSAGILVLAIAFGSTAFATVAAKKGDLKVSKEYAHSDLIVRYKNGTTESEKNETNRKHNTTVSKKLSSSKNVYKVHIENGEDSKKVSEDYKKDPNVLYAEPNYVLHALVNPNDPSYSDLWSNWWII